MNKFIKVDSWDGLFTEAQSAIINVSKVTFVEPYKVYHFENFENVVNDGLKLSIGNRLVFIKMSIDECLEMLNG